MAELCLKCFLETWRPNAYDRTHVVMSTDNEFCEGCLDCVPYVDHIDPSDLQLIPTVEDWYAKIAVLMITSGELITVSP